MTEVDVLSLMESCGFESTGSCAASSLAVRPEVRDMCAADKCQSYNRSWACPPGCGSIEEYQAVFDTKSRCFVAQTVMDMEDSFDVETIMEAATVQADRFARLFDLVREAAPDAMVLSSGTCVKCPTCTYPDAPCRFPDDRLVSMEAAGLVVNDVCVAAGVPYNHGPNTIAYTGCVLI